MTVNMGAEALSTAASPLVICVWPQAFRECGTRLFSRPMMAKLRHTRHGCARECPSAMVTATSAVVVMIMRRHTSVNGGNSRRASWMRLNEPPHRKLSRINRPHSSGPMVKRPIREVVGVLIVLRVRRARHANATRPAAGRR